MIDCAVIGDSIALGVGLQLHGCAVNAQVGAPSSEIIGRVEDAHVLVVSAGSNDAHNPELEHNIRTIRSKAHGHVVWIAPADPKAAAVVQRVAYQHGDRVVHFKPREDNIHPRDYGQLAGKVQFAMRMPGV
ncbi:MAG: hypothetical protein JO348_04840 [Alphaproteobacteria bacterium]|nr:hypothetical protein [Alphaproteobacteria bacterium]